MYAVIYGHIEVVRMLVSYGGDPTSLCGVRGFEQPLSPLDCARQNGKEGKDMVTYFLNGIRKNEEMKNKVNGREEKEEKKKEAEEEEEVAEVVAKAEEAEAEEAEEQAEEQTTMTNDTAAAKDEATKDTLHELELDGISDDDDDNDDGDDGRQNGGFRTLSPERLPKSLVLTESGSLEEREDTAELMESASSIVYSERDDDEVAEFMESATSIVFSEQGEEEEVLSDIDMVVEESGEKEGEEEEERSGGGEGGALRSSLALVGTVLEEVTRTRLGDGAKRQAAMTSPLNTVKVAEELNSNLKEEKEFGSLDLSREDEDMLEESFNAAAKELAEKKKKGTRVQEEEEEEEVKEMETGDALLETKIQEARKKKEKKNKSLLDIVDTTDPEERELQQQIQEAEERLRCVLEKEKEKSRRDIEREEIVRRSHAQQILVDQQLMSESLRRGIILSSDDDTSEEEEDGDGGGGDGDGDGDVNGEEEEMRRDMVGNDECTLPSLVAPAVNVVSGNDNGEKINMKNQNQIFRRPGSNFMTRRGGEMTERGGMLGRPGSAPPPPPPRERPSPPSPSKKKRPGSQQSSMMNRLRTSERKKKLTVNPSVLGRGMQRSHHLVRSPVHDLMRQMRSGGGDGGDGGGNK